MTRLLWLAASPSPASGTAWEMLDCCLVSVGAEALAVSVRQSLSHRGDME